MRRTDRRRMEVSRRKWDEAVPLHVASAEYDVAAFMRGASTLKTIEVNHMGRVKGLSLLHLQCHFGLDTLSWARSGASVVGVDYSPVAVETARNLAKELAIRATFIRSNVFDLPRRLHRRFTIVYTGKGALGWLPTLEPWGRVVARFLRPGGRLVMLEDHPLSDCLADRSSPTNLVLAESYFRETAIREVYDGTYATRIKMRHRVSYGWIHTVSEVLNALIRAGLGIDLVREYPYTYWRRFPSLKLNRDGCWHPTRGDTKVPLMWLVTASKPAN